MQVTGMYALKIAGQLMTFEPPKHTHIHTRLPADEALSYKDIKGDYPALQHKTGQRFNKIKKSSLPSIMVADLHSSTSKEPEMKAGGVGRGRGEEAPGYHRDTVELMGSRAAVCMWLTPWLTLSLRHPQT